MIKFVYKYFVMDLQTRKINFVQEFLKLQNEELILRLENLLKKEYKNETGIIPMSTEEFNIRIEQSLDDSRSGRLTGTDDLLNEIEGWK